MINAIGSSIVELNPHSDLEDSECPEGFYEHCYYPDADLMEAFPLDSDYEPSDQEILQATIINAIWNYNQFHDTDLDYENVSEFRMLWRGCWGNLYVWRMKS